jgi:hypothetical protein
MASPFPGMDPYLENPGIFPDFHDRFIAYLSESMQPALPEPYVAALGRRAWVEVSERFIGPDVNGLHSSGSSSGSPVNAQAAAAATCEVTQPIVVHVPHDEQVETRVELYIGRGQDRRLVTAIELLSPANKTAGERGRELYLRKQAELLNTKTHLVEIDLLRGGLHTTAVPKDRMRRKVAPTPYHVCSHRFDRFEDFLIHPIRLQDKLPTIAIPLLPDDGEIVISLQQVFERTYAAGPYHREIDYASEVPPPPLDEPDYQWVHQTVMHRAMP